MPDRAARGVLEQDGFWLHLAVSKTARFIEHSRGPRVWVPSTCGPCPDAIALLHEPATATPLLPVREVRENVAVRRRLLILCGLMASQSLNASAATTVDSERAGRFTIEREHYINDGPPIMHVADEDKRNRLIWTSLDGRVRFSLEDDGSELSSRANIQTGEKEACLSFGPPFAYPVADEPESGWKARFRNQLNDFLAGCPGINREQRRAYVAELEVADRDYALAVAKFKIAAQEAFGGWRRRCLKFKRSNMVMAHGGPPLRDCVRYSAETN